MNLNYIDDSGPGIRRKQLRGRFAYFDATGKRIKDADEIARIDALAIPPAYTDVWISPDPRGHIQATARDARRRKQYRYHAHWREVRDANKYAHLLEFGKALPRIRARVARDLTLGGMPREKVLATVVRLLDLTLIRVGNEQYARANKSYGLTTLRNRHVAIRGCTIRFRFKGKSGVAHDVVVSDPGLARILRGCIDIPGQELFQYLDESGEPRPVGSADVNAYLQEAGRGEFTAKDYRTWAGSVYAMSRLQTRAFESAAEATRNLVETVKEVAARLGNTAAVCRKCYIHPAVTEAYIANELAAYVLAAGSPAPKKSRLRADEAAFLRFLERVASLASTSKADA